MMNITYQQEFEELMDQAYDLPDYEPQKVKILEKAIKLAEAHNNIDFQFKAKLEYIDATTFCNMPEKGLAIFPWLLAVIEKYPDRFDDWDIMWRYKWVIGDLPLIPQLPLAQINMAVEDFVKTYESKGYGQQTIYEYRRELAIDLGDEKTVKHYHQKLLEEFAGSHGSMSDCTACVQNDLVKTAIFLKDYEQAFKYAQPILDGRMTCHSIPIRTYNQLIYAYVQVGDFEKVKEAGRKLLKAHKRVNQRKELYPNTILYCWATESYSTGFTYIARFLDGHHYDEMVRLYFYINTAKLFKSVMEKEEAEVKIKLPEQHPLYQADQEHAYATSDLYEWFLKEATLLAKRFDKRNENQYYETYLKGVMDLKRS